MRGYSLMELTTDPELFKAATQWVYDRLDQGRLTPRIDRTFKLAGIAEAHRYMEANQQIGEAVVTP